jgi:hydrogenase nickel incorporation protein HypA/HybF
MHEISLVRSIFNTLEDQFSEEELKGLTAIDLEVGKLSNVEPLLMQNAFQAVTSAEEIYQSVKLNVEVIPVEVYCSKCDSNSTISNYKFACGKCGLHSSDVIKGTELLIRRVHFEENDEVEV